jgi:hypothetical protein
MIEERTVTIRGKVDT